MRRCLILYGLTCIIAQILALREIAVAFHGNELIYGAALATWLLLVAAGSGLLGRVVAPQATRPARIREQTPARTARAPMHPVETPDLVERCRLSVSAFVLTLAAAGVLVPATLLAARLARLMIAGRSGVTPSFGGMLLATLLLLAPLCLVLGFFFALACAIAMRAPEPPSRVATRVYVFEAIGTFIGGVLFTYLFIQLAGAFLIAVAIAVTNCLAAFTVWWHNDRRSHPWGWGLLVAAALFAAVLLSPVGKVIDFASQAARFPHQVLRETLDTPYGRIDVTESGNQTSFYQSGSLAGATHMDRAAEETAFLAMLAHPAPKRVLMIGGCLTGVLRKVLELPWVSVDYVELDPALIEMARRFAAPPDRAALNSPRVRVFTNVDGRLFVKRSDAKYDVILSVVPNPTTGLINRFYTAEFFSEAKRSLADDGILAISLSGSPAYMGAPHRALAASICDTLRSVFTSVTLLPSDNAIYYLASPQQRAILTGNLSALPGRLSQWELKPAWLTVGTLREIVNPDRIRTLLSALEATRVPAINTDLHPVAYYHALLLWSEAFQTWGQASLRRALGMDLWSVLIAVTVMTGMLSLATTFAPRPLWVGLPATRAYAGMVGFVLELVLIFAFQSLYGYAYSQLGVIFAAFMIGITLGAVVTERLDVAPSELKMLMLMQTALSVLAAAIVPILTLLGRCGPDTARWGAAVVIPVLNLGVGALVGAQYPLSVAACAKVPGTHRFAGLAAGLYAMDLAGACLGALLGGAVLIPVLGLPRTCWAMSITAVASLPLLLLSERRREGRNQSSRIP